MKKVLNSDLIEKKLKEYEIRDLDLISIRELVHIVNELESETGEKFIRMEMGVPGLPPNSIGVDAEIEILKKNIASKYPMIDGTPELKNEASKFLKLFLNADIPPELCIPTVGSMQGAFAAFLTLCRKDPEKDTVLFIDPGFPVQKMQLDVLGMKYKSFDIYNYRGANLEKELESFLADNNISTIVYSTPNNPTWICLSEHELKIIAKLANKYNVTVVEDLAYFGMDFRHDYSQAGKPPFPPSISAYSDNYLLLLSSSKIFSYAGQRIAILAVSPNLFNQRFENLKNFFGTDIFGKALIYKALYTLSAGTSHSAQYAFAAILKAVNNGEINFIEPLTEYKNRASKMKQIFLKNGFEILYDKDENEDIGDGFYFTIAHPLVNSEELLKALLAQGISAISLTTSGSTLKKGIRACVSQINQDDFALLEKRLLKFQDAIKSPN
jgi:aspartate/methionine/tyrosine aminotransferase